MIPLRSILILFTGLLAVARCDGQLFDLGLRAAGPPCDSTLVVDFTVQDNGLMSYTYTADIDTGDVTITGLAWSYFNVSLANNYASSFTEQYYAPGQYPMCLTVEALDPSNMPCSSTTCTLVTVYADSSCTSLDPDFTISTVQGNSVTFAELSDFQYAIAGYSWSLGDGTVDTGAYVTHTYAGTGPYEVCHTVIGAPPNDECSATACKWLYLGPGSVPCATLLQHGFLTVQIDNTVGVLDTSVTSGMYYSVTWDFGDGTTASGQVAYHTYPNGGAYNVCGTVSLWGPLATDTCTSTVCESVYVALTGIREETSVMPLRTWPTPTEDLLHVDVGAHAAGPLDLVDATGRSVRSLGIARPGVNTFDVSGLAKGAYVLRYLGTDRPSAVRVLKH